MLKQMYGLMVVNFFLNELTWNDVQRVTYFRSRIYELYLGTLTYLDSSVVNYVNDGSCRSPAYENPAPAVDGSK